jgi:Zinc dependent phospholipase C
MGRRTGKRGGIAPVALALALVLAAPHVAAAYSVLAHEAIIDAAWDASIVPTLRARFHPSPADLKRARAFAYGGSLIQDIGYYPFSSRLFGNLTHYVRSGDFIEALLRESTDVTEYAFALGALAHYAADNDGHPLAVNRAVPALYPKLRARFGNDVTYAQSPAAHLKTEFGFDVVQVARGKYAADAYHDVIGFEVSKPVLERAFQSTYGLELKDVFSSLDLAIGTFRWTVSRTIPGMTKVAWELKNKEIVALMPGVTGDTFRLIQTRAEYEKAWGTEYGRPGFVHKVLAGLFRIVPRFGPFKAFAFKPPTPETERWFLDSFAKTVTQYRVLIDESSRPRPVLENRNFDTGRLVKAGDYPLVDATYARLVETLVKRQEAGATIPRPLRANIMTFYANLDAPIETRKHRKEWARLLRDLDRIKPAG